MSPTLCCRCWLRVFGLHAPVQVCAYARVFIRLSLSLSLSTRMYACARVHVSVRGVCVCARARVSARTRVLYICTRIPVNLILLTDTDGVHALMPGATHNIAQILQETHDNGSKGNGNDS